eukprot:4771381-Lingulodinium_polyedra.AAC.1
MSDGYSDEAAGMAIDVQDPIEEAPDLAFSEDSHLLDALRAASSRPLPAEAGEAESVSSLGSDEALEGSGADEAAKRPRRSEGEPGPPPGPSDAAAPLLPQAHEPPAALGPLG